MIDLTLGITTEFLLAENLFFLKVKSVRQKKSNISFDDISKVLACQDDELVVCTGEFLRGSKSLSITEQDVIEFETFADLIKGELSCVVMVRPLVVSGKSIRYLGVTSKYKPEV